MKRRDCKTAVENGVVRKQNRRHEVDFEKYDPPKKSVILNDESVILNEVKKLSRGGAEVPSAPTNLVNRNPQK